MNMLIGEAVKLFPLIDANLAMLQLVFACISDVLCQFNQFF